MKQIVIKRWIDGEFKEVDRYSEAEVKQIRHHRDGLELILNGYIRQFDTQCIMEFDDKEKEVMTQYIDKDALVAEINRQHKILMQTEHTYGAQFVLGFRQACRQIIDLVLIQDFKNYMKGE